MRMPREKTAVVKREKNIRADRDKRKSSRNRRKEKCSLLSLFSDFLHR